MTHEPHVILAAWYVWLRDVATTEQIVEWTIRRSTSLAADRVCAAGIDGRHPLDVISDPKGLARVSALKNLKAAP